MRPLQKEFEGRGEVRGYTFKQIRREPEGYVYEVGGSPEVRYEVFKHKENERYDIVRYPNANAFGKWAYSVSSLERADELLKKWKQEAAEPK